nr:hypothetical protein [Tanacetum cinerariifolium]
MSRDVITVGSTMRIPLLYRGEYSQWRERFINYLEEKTDDEVMINSIQNGDHPFHVVAQVSLAGTAPNAISTLKDPEFWTDEEKKTQKIDRLARLKRTKSKPKPDKIKHEMESVKKSNKSKLKSKSNQSKPGTDLERARKTKAEGVNILLGRPVPELMGRVNPIYIRVAEAVLWVFLLIIDDKFEEWAWSCELTSFWPAAATVRIPASLSFIDNEFKEWAWSCELTSFWPAAATVRIPASLLCEEASKVESCLSEIILDDLLALDSIVRFDFE